MPCEDELLDHALHLGLGFEPGCGHGFGHGFGHSDLYCFCNDTFNRCGISLMLVLQKASEGGDIGGEMIW